MNEAIVAVVTGKKKKSKRKKAPANAKQNITTDATNTDTITTD